MKQGDIVGSEGRIETVQDGRKRYIEFEQALVLDIGPDGITVNPVGKNAVLLCQEDDLHVETAATKAAPSLKGVLKESAEQPKPKPKSAAPKRRAKRPSAYRPGT